MSDGVEAIIKNTKRARETLDSSGTAPLSKKTPKKPAIQVAWKTLLSDWGMGAIIPVVTLVLWQLAGSTGLVSATFCRLRFRLQELLPTCWLLES